MYPGTSGLSTWMYAPQPRHTRGLPNLSKREGDGREEGREEEEEDEEDDEEEEDLLED